MDIDLLRTFIEVYRLRNFGAAARSLHVTQAAVSARVKLLESQLGTQLFDRSKKEIRVTPEGHRFLHSADIILSEWRRARQSASYDGTILDQLSIAGSLRLWDIFLQQNWLHKLREKLPNLGLTVYSDSPDTLISKLFEGIIDVVVTLEPPRMELMSSTKLKTIDLVLVSTHPGLSTSSAIERPDFVWVDWGQSFDIEFRQHYSEQRVPLTQVSNCSIALELIKHMGGSTYIPLRIAKRKIDAGELFPISDSPVIARDVFGSYLQRNPKIGLIKQCLAVLAVERRVDLKALGYHQ